MSNPPTDFPIVLSIGIMAWNEETSIVPMLASLFDQNIFAQLAAHRERCEIVCLANGCTDRTVAVTREIFARMTREHPDCRGMLLRVEDITTPGRNNAWNRFVHEFSARDARYICLMDADIIFNRPDTLSLVVRTMKRDSRLGGASDWPVKNITGKAQLSWRERVSLATSDLTGTIPGRLNGMLYCLRADIARNLYLPRDVLANDDGFFKAAICTDFFRAPLDSSKVVSVREATHLYEPYLLFRDVLNNQKRQMIGQATVHVIIEHLQTLPEDDRAHLALTLQRLEASDPDWLKKLIDAHVARTRLFWRLFPGILGFRWRRLSQTHGMSRLTHLPATIAGFFVTLIACWQATQFLRRGVTNYWPKAARQAALIAPALGVKQGP
jgi:glycosyltransferase involved in cell wall biosynthesis